MAINAGDTGHVAKHNQIEQAIGKASATGIAVLNATTKPEARNAIGALPGDIVTSLTEMNSKIASGAIPNGGIVVFVSP